MTRAQYKVDRDFSSINENTMHSAVHAYMLAISGRIVAMNSLGFNYSHRDTDNLIMH